MNLSLNDVHDSVTENTAATIIGTTVCLSIILRLMTSQ